MVFPLPAFFLEKKHPKSGDFIKISFLKNNKSFVGLEGYVVPFKIGYLVLESGNKRVIISKKDNKIEYVLNGKKYKI